MAANNGLRLPAALRRRQLLDAAVEVFANGGFDGTAMNELAEAAGVTKPVLYQHFGSKRALYRELLEDVGRQLQETISIATAGASSAHQQVESGFAAYFRFAADKPAAFRILLGGATRKDDEFNHTVRQVEEVIADTISSLFGADIDPEHRHLLSHALIGMAEGISRRFLDGEVLPDPEVLARRTAELAWAGLRGIGSTGWASRQASVAAAPG